MRPAGQNGSDADPMISILHRSYARLLATSVVLGVVSLSAPGFAAESSSEPEERLQRLEDALEAQNQKIAEQARALDKQARVIAEQQDTLERLWGEIGEQRVTLQLHVEPDAPWANLAGTVPLTADYYGGLRYHVWSPIHPAVYTTAGPGATQAAGAQFQRAQADDQVAPVGEPPSRAVPASDLAGVREVGGVLTPKGVLVVEPQFQYSQSNISRFFFQGVEIAETLLIGLIEATDSDRDTLVASAALRYGVTDRLEVEVRVPVVYRDDRVIRRVISTQEETRGRLDAFSVGDIEASARYQINDGSASWPIFVGNLRVKSITGVGPFDVDRDEDGIEQELPTGSGFWAVQPGITAIYPSDPVVFFGNVNYLWHFEMGIDEEIGESFIGDVDPGDVIGVSMGMGLALNERTSFSITYEHNFILKTTTEVNGVDVESETLDVGLLRFGFGYRLKEWLGLNVNLGVGVTEDAPDVTITIRTPIRFSF